GPNGGNLRDNGEDLPLGRRDAHAPCRAPPRYPAGERSSGALHPRSDPHQSNCRSRGSDEGVARMNPLDMQGPDFLVFYVCTLLIVGFVAVGLRWVLRVPGEETGDAAPQLDSYEVAYLSGAARQAVDVALVSLVNREVLAVDMSDRKLTVRGPLPNTA